MFVAGLFLNDTSLSISEALGVSLDFLTDAGVFEVLDLRSGVKILRAGTLTAFSDASAVEAVLTVSAARAARDLCETVALTSNFEM